MCCTTTWEHCKFFEISNMYARSIPYIYNVHVNTEIRQQNTCMIDTIYVVLYLL